MGKDFPRLFEVDKRCKVNLAFAYFDYKVGDICQGQSKCVNATLTSATYCDTVSFSAYFVTEALLLSPFDEG
jgi:hypothetical protein